MQDKETREILYKGRIKPGELFQIPTSTFSSTTTLLGQLVKSSVWHQRLGHPTNEVLSVMLAKSLICHSINDVHKMCIACIHGKTTRTLFPNESNMCILPYDRVYRDVCGPSPFRSTEGYIYYVIFVDDCIRFV